jgi:Fic family protein
MEEHIRHSNLIEGIDDPAEDKQSMVAWEYLIKEPTIAHSTVCRVQKIITLHQKLLPNQRGYYRGMAGNDVNVRVGNHDAPAPAMVLDLMSNWILDCPKLTPKEAHIRFEKIHPFVDGNGRTGRMLMWWHELKLGLKPSLIKSNEADRHYYYEWFRQ